MIKKIVKDHHTVGYTGIMLIGMGIISFAENLFGNIFGINFTISHGLIFMGVFNILLAIAFIIMGTANVEMSIEQTKDQESTETFLDKITTLSKEIEELKKEIASLKQ